MEHLIFPLGYLEHCTFVLVLWTATGARVSMDFEIRGLWYPNSVLWNIERPRMSALVVIDSKPNSISTSSLLELKDTTCYAGLLLAPAEGFSLWQRLFFAFWAEELIMLFWPKKSKKKLFYLFFFRLRKKSYPLRFPKLKGRDSTRALQSSRFQKYKNLKKC